MRVCLTLVQCYICNKCETTSHALWFCTQILFSLWPHGDLQLHTVCIYLICFLFWEEPFGVDVISWILRDGDLPSFSNLSSCLVNAKLSLSFRPILYLKPPITARPTSPGQQQPTFAQLPFAQLAFAESDQSWFCTAKIYGNFAAFLLR